MLQLSRREHAVARLLGQGKTNKVIAFELQMSDSTAKVHVRNIMHKLQCTNRTQAAVKIVRNEMGPVFAYEIEGVS